MSNNQTTSEIRGGVGLFTFSTIVLMLFYVLPQTVVFINNNVMAIIVTIYYALFISKYVPPATIINSFALALPYLFLYWINGFWGDFKLGFVLPCMTLWTLVMPCYVVIAIKKRNNLFEQKSILIATIICLLYVSISTFRALAIDPVIMREMAGGDAEIATPMRLMGVGGFGIAYSLGALFISLWTLHSYYKSSLVSFIFYLVVLIGCGLLVVQSQYATLLFITIFGLAFSFFIQAKTPQQKMIIIGVSLVFIIMFQGLIVLGISFFEGQVLGVKFQLIYDGIWGGNGTENISGDRSQFHMDALRMFLKSPFWGYNGFASAETYDTAHSTILSVMTASGLIGIVSYFSFFHHVVKRMMGCLFNKRNYNYYYPVILFYICFAVLNPIDYSFDCSWVIFMIIPLFIFMTLNREV